MLVPRYELLCSNLPSFCPPTLTKLIISWIDLRKVSILPGIIFDKNILFKLVTLTHNHYCACNFSTLLFRTRMTVLLSTRISRKRDQEQEPPQSQAGRCLAPCDQVTSRCLLWPVNCSDRMAMAW